MLKVIIKEIRKIVIEEDKELESFNKEEAIIKVKAVGICGSDMHVYAGENPVLSPPRVPGHEFGGIIKNIGSENNNLKVGMKVVVNPVINCGKCFYCKNSMEYLCENQSVIGGDIEGAMKEEIIVPIKNIIKLPNSFDLLYSPLIEPTAVAIHTVNKIYDSTVLVIGMGTIGLLIQQICKNNNNKLISMDIKDYPLKLSKELGADLAINFNDNNKLEILYKFLNNSKIDVVIDTVCSYNTSLFLASIVRKGGKIFMVGIPTKNYEFDIIKIICNEIGIIPNYLYRDLEFKKAADQIIEGKIMYKPLLSKVFDLKDAKDAFEFKDKNPTIKVILKNDN
ncbi:MAG: alcohol dehydrogenase catalytic domain-containing protein [Actinobacteria bacterium]|nr:alcohol dehydrogenase catalytic domain-containing protein [Cyanobacteriota bacterium]MCL5771349.1 alcohol dehydrogenase catalytic domain-containing protein [Actinomycetota bacterium]